MNELEQKIPRLRNWQAFIYNKIDNARLDVITVKNDIKDEIDKCWCMEYATDEEYIAMLDYMDYKATWYVTERDRIHKDKIAEIHKNQELILEQKKQKELLIQADKDFTRRFGRMPRQKGNHNENMGNCT